MPRPRHRLASTCIGTVTAGLLATGAALAAPEEQSSTTGHTDIAMGAYLDYGPPGVARIPFLSNWLGGKEIRVGHTYLPGDQWAGIEGNVGFLDDWAQWRRQRTDRLFVLNVPMQERNEDRIPDRQVAQLIRAGAEGQYDRHFKKLAERLVALGVPDTVIVLGWEMNGVTYTHRCGPDPENWKAYWKRVVNTMRSVPGQKFKFDFTPNRGTDAIGWTKCYPGDDVVDIVGMDSYDQGPGRTFDDQISQPYGLQQHVDFARAHGKEISYPEWGLFRNGDNPEYVRRMLQWIEKQKPLYHTITDYCPHGVWQCKQNPASTKVFREALTPQRPDPVIPTPVVPTPVVPTPVVPTPVVPTPVIPTPQVPTPEIPTPVVTPPVVLPSPELPSPVAPSPVQPSPVEPSPLVPSPVEPSPVVPSPVEPSPVAPSPVVPKPSPVVPSPEIPVEPSPAVPSPVEPSPAVPSPVEPSPVVPSPEVSPVVPEVPASPSPSPVVPKPSPEVPSPVPSQPPKPTTPTPPVNSTEWCVPINFGEWLSKLVGKQSVCIKVDWGKETGFWPF
ncbi:glycosyl hydrolase [Streptomyces sp. ZAF1911]|uniref:glycoside hydrolase family 26 protein n=1 Tax=Streptomyces sp. ZAF1911 TaxID=2944129 RepID=UPI00237B2B35|nr:glycosyl hydrolase [Streptomyces sp. ZAF1911]MDD9382660.1 glycosyl hydrolase [Streptomyces sp. ZAF1911]